MDCNKIKDIKSKSSSNTVVQKLERKDKNIKSNAQFMPQGVKKRGVYVENKPVDMSQSAQEPEILKENQPIPPPRPGRKKFVTSVLTILTKTPNDTQHPAKIDLKPALKKNFNDEKKKLIPTQIEEVEDLKKISSNRTNTKVEPKKRKKFRSRVLNNDREYADKLQVLQRTKEIRFSPIDSSSKEDLKWSELPKLVKSNDDERTSYVNNIVKEISEGRKITDSKHKIDEDPSTLVAAHQNDKKLYNFFVDLLESTFSLYDVKDNRDKKIVRSVPSSKVKFEIDEQVAQKLKVTKPSMLDDVTQKPSNEYHSIRNDINWNNDYFNDKPIYSKNDMPAQQKKIPVKRKKNNPLPFPLPKPRQPKMTSQSTQSAIVQQKKSIKTNLLNILKEQLTRETYVYEEPQNLYDALRAMARKKRKCRRTIRFANLKKNTPDIRDEFKKRNIIPPSSSSRYNKRVNQKSSDPIKHTMTKVPKRKIAETIEKEPSIHSIEVIEYNTFPKKRPFYPRKDYNLPYITSSSGFDTDDF